MLTKSVVAMEDCESKCVSSVEVDVDAEELEQKTLERMIIEFYCIGHEARKSMSG